jgi:hypothetical protein
MWFLGHSGNGAGELVAHNQWRGRAGVLASNDGQITSTDASIGNFDQDFVSSRLGHRYIYHRNRTFALVAYSFHGDLPTA